MKINNPIPIFVHFVKRPTDLHSRLIKFFCLVVLILMSGCNLTESRNDSKQATIGNTVTNWSETTGNAELDSMLYIAATAKQDTNLARLYYDIGDIYLDNDAQKAKEYYLKLGALSEDLNWNEGRYLFAAGYTDILNREGLTDSSIVIHQKALELAKMEMNELQIAKISANIGTCYNYKKWYETAMQYYKEALPIFEKRGDKFRVAHLYSLMTAIYNNMNLQDDNLLYCEKALDILNERPDSLPRAYVLINYAIALTERQQFEQAENCLLEAQRICILNNSRYNLYEIYNTFGYIAMKKYEWQNMEAYARKALEITLEFGDVEGFSESKRMLGHVELFKGNFSKSEEYTREALDTALAYDLPMEKKKSYRLLSDISIARHDFHSNRYYEAKADSIDDVLMSEITLRSVKELEAKYETEKKVLKIAALEDEKRFMIWIGIACGFVLLLTLASFFFLWRWAVQKKRLSEQRRVIAEARIKQLEQEKQLVATQAVLDGETKERARLARDLHDGLGSILTGAKLRFLEMKQGAKLAYADLERFDRALGMLDQSVNEMRRVAHHLMPDSLSRFGLKTAVSDFCSNLPSVTFTCYGELVRLEPNIEVMIYRSIHELVNNALKHAGADNIMVQIIQDHDRIAFTIQDNGCGFDPSDITKGTGLQNIHTRVTSCNGFMHIDSKPGEGTEINIELKIER